MALCRMTCPDGFAAKLFTEMAEQLGIQAVVCDQEYARIVVFDRDHPMIEKLREDYGRNLPHLALMGLACVETLVAEYRDELSRRKAGLDATVCEN